MFIDADACSCCVLIILYRSVSHVRGPVRRAPHAAYVLPLQAPPPASSSRHPFRAPTSKERPHAPPNTHTKSTTAGRISEILRNIADSVVLPPAPTTASLRFRVARTADVGTNQPLKEPPAGDAAPSTPLFGKLLGRALGFERPRRRCHPARQPPPLAPAPAPLAPRPSGGCVSKRHPAHSAAQRPQRAQPVPGAALATAT